MRVPSSAVNGFGLPTRVCSSPGRGLSLLALVLGIPLSCSSSTATVVTTEGEEIDPKDIMGIEVVVEKCEVPDLKTYFDFDSDEMGASENLDKIAACLTQGPLRTTRVLLVGHTDPIGTSTYNEKLGLARARKVASYLVGKGVEENRIKYQSLGKTRASGNKKAYAKDRRVDINLLF